MNLIMFKFFIDFNLGLPTEQFAMKLDDKNVIINCQKYDTLNCQTFTSLDTNWAKDKENTKVIESKAINKNGEKYLNREIFINTNESFKYGYRDYITSNILVMVFEEYKNYNIMIPEGLEYHYEKAKLFFKDFINRYRLVTNFQFIPNPNSFDLPLIEVSICKNKSIQNIYAKESLNFTYLTYKGKLDDPFIKGHTDYIHPDCRTLNSLVKNLNQCEEIQLYDELLLNAKEQAYVKKDYSLCIVLCETAFETFLQFKLKEICIKKRITNLKTYYRGKENSISYKSAIEKGNVKENLLKGYINFIFTINIEDTDEYKNWDKNSYKKRNDIIHKGFLNFKLKDAQDAFYHTLTFMNFIKNLK